METRFQAYPKDVCPCKIHSILQYCNTSAASLTLIILYVKNVENSPKIQKKIMKENEIIFNSNEYFNSQNGMLNKISFS
jgi:hypothetical protein